MKLPPLAKRLYALHSRAWMEDALLRAETAVLQIVVRDGRVSTVVRSVPFPPVAEDHVMSSKVNNSFTLANSLSHHSHVDHCIASARTKSLSNVSVRRCTSVPLALLSRVETHVSPS